MKTKRLVFQQNGAGSALMQYLGKNGYSASRGIDLEIQDNGKFMIRPINSKGEAGRCFIEAPTDPATIRELAELLLEVASEAEASLLLKNTGEVAANEC